MNKLYPVFILLLISTAGLHAQDIHLSNYQPAGMLFNPSLTATNKADVQVGIQYRSQWATIPEAYTTVGATGEIKHKRMGFGFQIHQNKAGEASLKTTNIQLTGAYHKQLAQDGDLSLGVGVGRIQKRVNPALLTFDNQYAEGVGYDPSLLSHETFDRASVSITDFAIGLNWRGNWGNTNNLRSSFGLSLSHIHLPDEGFFGDMSELPMKTAVHGNLELKIDNKVIVAPHFMVQKQGVHQELVGGVRINGNFDKKSEFNAGLAYRWGDAAIIQLGLDIGNKSLWASYDSNISTLESASKGQGAWEMGLYLRFDKNKKKQLKDTDGDGTFDNRDKCVTVPGLPELEGCPLAEDVAKTDADNDGVTDDLDRCPLEPGLPCFYGCNDRDRDGVLDRDDACPEIFGHPDNQGCPVNDRDSDRDGVMDSEDFCVYLKGLPEFHGCPDSDADGVSDIDDECPYLKGSILKRGCPTDAARKDAMPDVVVEFDTDQSIIKPAFKLLLDDFVKQAIDKQQVAFMISGHTDGEGDDAYNYELGLRRARAVKDYCSHQGIPFEGMKIISYGEEIPKRSNVGEAGRAANRRVEVVILKE